MGGYPKFLSKFIHPSLPSAKITQVETGVIYASQLLHKRDHILAFQKKSITQSKISTEGQQHSFCLTRRQFGLNLAI